MVKWVNICKVGKECLVYNKCYVYNYLLYDEDDEDDDNLYVIVLIGRDF